ncbi:MAG TPA: type I-C CRISPR-associated protein Cas8c/Csd1 [Urbifossiella sp.]|nr:type I-C CRISPR-associated protein Cas8c/Csd1 [Urbifossiella sp.]
MILRRLYELAEWAELLADPSVEPTPVACVVKVGKGGRLNGLLDVRQDMPKGKKTVKTGGLMLPVPMRAMIWDTRAERWKVTDPAGSGVCRFIRYVAEQTGHATLKGLSEFGDRVLADDPELVAQVAAEIAATGLSISQGLCTLERTADVGPALSDREVMRWWQEFYEADMSAAQADLPVGVCQVTHRRAPLSSSVTVRVNGLTPIGCRADAYLVVGLESADSYGLKGAQAGMVSAAGIDGFTRAIHTLLTNQLPNKRRKEYVGGMRSSMRVGGTQFLFWTRDMEGSSGVEILDAKPDEYAALLEVVNKPVESGPNAISAPDEFRILALGGNSARVVVRDYLERPLGEVRANLRQWLDHLRIADTSKQYQGRPNAAFPLWLLATATALEAVSHRTRRRGLRMPPSPAGRCRTRSSPRAWRGSGLRGATASAPPGWRSSNSASTEPNVRRTR